MRLAPIAAFVLFAGAAQAQVRKLAVVVVARESELDGQALLAERTLSARMAKDPRFELVKLDSGARAAGSPGMAERSRAAHELFIRGVNSLDALKYPAAVEHLDGSVKAYLETDLTSNFLPLLDSIGMRAVALRLRRAGNPAEDELSRLFTLNPDYRFAPGRWPPAVQSWIDKGQEAIRATALTGLTVTSPVAAAEVYVDGAFKGVTPLEVKGLVPGRHFLTLVAPGHLTKQLEVEAVPGATSSPRLEVAPQGRELLSRLANLKAGFAYGTADAAGKSLVEFAGAPEVVAVALEARGEELWAEAARLTASGQLAVKAKSLGKKGANALEELGELAIGLFSEAPPLVQAEVKASSGGGGRRTVGLVVIGVGAASGVGGALMALQAKAMARQTYVTPQTHEAAYQQAAASARGSAILADGLFVLAAAGLGTGLYLALTGGEPTPPGAMAVEVALTPGGAGASLGGTF